MNKDYKINDIVQIDSKIEEENLPKEIHERITIKLPRSFEAMGEKG